MILITGGTGTSGVPILRELASTGKPFRVLVRDPAKINALRLPNVEVAVGDLSNPASIRAALHDVDRALLNSGSDPKQAELQGNFITAAKAAGVKHLVKFSAMGANPASTARFLRIHGQAEEQIRASGMAFTFLRPTFFFQNLLGLAAMAKQGYIYQPAADGRSAFVDVRDIATVAVKVLTERGHEGKAYDLTGPKAIGYHDIAAAFTELLRKEVQYVDVPSAHAKQGLMEAGYSNWAADWVNELLAQMRAGAFLRVSNVVSDVAGRDSISLQQFVSDYADIFRGAKTSVAS